MMAYTMQSSEDNEQQTLIQWVQIMRGRYPQLWAVFHVPNEGKRSRAEGARQRSMGLEPGVPDIFLDAPAGKYHGLRLELKYAKNKPTPAQDKWLRRLRGNGYFVAVCYSARAAERLIEEYLALHPGWIMEEDRGLPLAAGYPVLHE